MSQKNTQNDFVKTAVLAVGAGALLAAAGAIAKMTRQRRISLSGKTVLITGGSRGLGLILARLVSAEGARVALCARNADELARAKTDLIGRGAREADVQTFVCDVSDAHSIGQTVEAVQSVFGNVDVLINNAGTIQVGPMESMTEADYIEAFAIHFWAPYRFVEAVLPAMRQRGEGRIVNISSIGGLVRVPHLLPYCASKSALVGYSEGLRAELLRSGIFVTTVCPGLIRTGSPRNAFFKGQNVQEYAWFKLGDSLPFVSQSADAAGAEIIAALKNGDAFVVTSLPAKQMALAHGIFPGAVADALGVVNTFLPEPGGIGTQRKTGRESEGAVSLSPLTALTERAAADNNQIT